MIDTLQFLNGRMVESAPADNALATATAAAVLSVRHFITGIAADFSGAASTAFRLVQIKFGTTVVKNIRWDTTKSMPLWFGGLGFFHGDYNQAVSAELAASGTGGVTGIVTLYVFSM